MATSGTIDWLADRDEIITEALEQLGILAEGDTPSSDQLTSCGRTLNYMVKGWQARGLPLWAMQRQYVFLQKAQRVYSLVGTTSDHVSTEIYQTTTSAAAAASATTITVADGSDFTTGDKVGVQLTSGTDVEWTTSATVSSNTITVSALSTAVDSGAVVYGYTNKGGRPYDLTGPVVVRNKDSVDVPVEIISRQEYHDLTNKTSDGRPNQVYYDPQVGTGKLFVWPEASQETDYLVMWVNRTLEDYDAAGDDSDFPQEWFMALSYNLALNLVPKFGASSESFNQIKALAGMWLADAESSDTEAGMDWRPDERSRRG